MDVFTQGNPLFVTSRSLTLVEPPLHVTQTTHRAVSPIQRRRPFPWTSTSRSSSCAAHASLGDKIKVKDDVYAEVADKILPVGIGGLVLAAAVAAMMSTASGALIAAATVARNDVVPMITGKAKAGGDIVVASLTTAYDILVGGLLIAILGGFVWKRGNGQGAAASMIVGTVVTLGTMAVLAVQLGDPLLGILDNKPIYFGLLASLVTFVAVSLATKPVRPEVREEWDARVSGRIETEGVRTS
ncbi:hypothetical protein FV141_12385 [Dermacoccus abyssi]|uniref:Uncharacterized protein n=1 Tax=Dermacoccus abyssi TaxID=322596 RepID=A0ABX5ZBK9_9MICO|nr:hypothetical protein FV141_12385 [Dermacoccus abyssi]